MHVKKGDKVKILSGQDKGKVGKIIKALPKLDKVVVEGINLRKRRTRPRRRGEEGQTLEKAAPIHVSNVKKIV